MRTRRRQLAAGYVFFRWQRPIRVVSSVDANTQLAEIEIGHNAYTRAGGKRVISKRLV